MNDREQVVREMRQIAEAGEGTAAWQLYDWADRLQAEQGRGEAWKPSIADYDKSIHSNPDARAWDKFFLAMFPNCGADEGLMTSWFANAMMAQHNHYIRTRPVPVPVVTEAMVERAVNAYNYDQVAQIRGLDWAWLDRKRAIRAALTAALQVQP